MQKESSWLQATITSAEMAGAAIARRGPTGTALQIDLLSGKQQQAPQPNPSLESACCCWGLTLQLASTC